MEQGLIKSLEKLGLPDKESRVYLAGLELGKFSVLALANKTGIKRPTCYLILDELVKKGLVTTFPKAKKVIYVAEHPNTLLKKSEDSLRVAKEIMPELQGLMDLTSEKPELKTYSGQKGIQQIYELMLDEKKDLYYITSVTELVKSAGKEFLDDWIKRRIALGVKTYRISVKEEEMLEIPLYVGGSENLLNCSLCSKRIHNALYNLYFWQKSSFRFH
jgi:sugar-specific transcriptional regulator TrmB